MSYWLAFVLTNIIEMPIAWFIIKQRSVFFIVFLINAVVHPITWFWYMKNPTAWGTPADTLILLEIMIALVEGLILAIIFRKKWLQALIAGIFMNSCSFLIGLLI
ncbi:MAG: hypothetical protein Q8P90_04860 [bacterium]|nr:hypothetical protein [bacterium]